MSASAKAPAKTEGELVRMLEARYSQDSGNGVSGCVIAQVRDAAGFDSKRSLDAVAMGFWPSRGLLIEGFECKSSRSDWLRELKDPSKAEQFIPTLDKFWIVAGGPGIVVEAELPPDWGLLVARGDRLVQVRAAEPLRDLTPIRASGPSRHKVRPLPPGFNRGFLVGLLRNGTARARVTPDEIQAAERRGCERGEAAARRDSGHYKERYDELYASVLAFQQESGIVIGSHGWAEHRKGPKEVGAAVRAVLNGQQETDRLVARLKRLGDDARAIGDHARERLASYGEASS